MILRMALISFSCALSTLTSRAWDYPSTPRSDTIDQYHGQAVPDPYRGLEDLDSPATTAWVAAQNQLTHPFLQQLPRREALKTRLTQLWNYERFGVPTREGGHYFVTHNTGLQNQGVLLIQDSLKDEPRVLLDPNTLSADGTVALTTFVPSPDGQRLAYGTAAAGSDWNEFKVRNLATGKDESDVLRWVKFSGLAWTHDGRGFFYSRYPEPGAGSTNATTFGGLEHQRLYYHRLGTDQARDQLILARDDQPKWTIGGGTSEDGRFLVVGLSQGASSNELLSFADLGDPAAPNLKAPLVPILDTWEAKISFLGNVGTTLYFLTNLDAPRNRLIAVDARHPERKNWTTLIPEGPDLLQSALLADGRLVVSSLHDATSRVSVYALSGQKLGEVPLPTLGTVDSLSGRQEDSDLFFRFTSYTYPSTTYRCDLATLKTEALFAPKVAFNPADYETRQVFYTSKDGTRIPLCITARKGLVPDGRTPTLLYGYGGFDISLTPTFSVATLAWLEMGGIYAVPNLRGGGEYGKDWHEAGTKERKQNVFDDFIGAAEYLFAQGYTDSKHLVLSGGSNGGLLVGAVVNQRPELCRVALPAVGVMDMLRFQKFTIGYAWVSDYGSSDDEKGFAYLRAYSPLHTVKTGAHYPAMLITTADHDDRVFPAHSYKLTATLQHEVYNGEGASPVLIRIETKAGHGAGKPTSKLIEESADKLAFSAYFLGL